MVNGREENIRKFTEWLDKQPTPKNKRDKEEYVKRVTDGNYHPLAAYIKKYGKSNVVLPEESLSDLYNASVNLKLDAKYISILNKCMYYRLSAEEEISPSFEKCGDGLSLYRLVSAIHRVREATDKNAYRLILSALLLTDEASVSEDTAVDHLRPEKSDRYKLYRHIMLSNLLKKFDSVSERLSEVLLTLSPYKPLYNSKLTYMHESMTKVGKELLKAFSDKEGFNESAVHHLLRQLAGASSDTLATFDQTDLSNHYANLIARLAIIALDNQGHGFSGNHLNFNCNTEKNLLVYTLLAPFSGSLTVELLENAGLFDTVYIKSLIYNGFLYPSVVPGSKYTRLATAGGYDSGLPETREGINLLKNISKYPTLEKLMHHFLSEIYSSQQKELKALHKNHLYHIDKGLFTFPKELVTLLPSLREEDAADKKNLRLETVLTKILAVAHWVCSRLFITGTKERFESEFRLSKLLTARPVTASSAIGAIPDFFDKIKDADKKNLTFNKRKENILLAKIKLSASEDALSVSDSALAAENFDVAEYYITASLKLSKDAIRIALSLGDIFTAADASSLCAEGYAHLALIRHTGHSAAMLLNDAVIPASKCLKEAEELLESTPDTSCTEFTISRRCYSEAVEFCSDTFYSPASPIFKVLSSDESIKIPFTLDYSQLYESASRLKLDEIPEDVRKSAHTWIPHKREQGQFFRPFYVTDFDSELTVRKNLTSEDIQPLLMKSVLSGNTIKLTANQLADNPELLLLSDSPGFLTLLQKGYISLSLYSNVKSLKEYVASSFKKQSFIFSSLPELNYYGENYDSKKASSIMEKRLLAMDYILGNKDISALPSSLRESLSLYKDRITLLDENLPTASKYYNYQRPLGISLSFSEQMNDFFEKRKNIAKFASLSRIHEIIKIHMPENYERSHYKLYTDRIEKGNLKGLSLSAEDKRFLLSFASPDNTKTSALMSDILTECQNTVLGSRVSPFIHYTYRSESKLLAPEGELLKPISAESETKYNDILRVDETGETIDFEALFSCLSFMERNIREAGDAFLPDKVAYTLSNPSLSYSIGKEGALVLDEAKLQITSGKNLSVANSGKDTSDSTLHLERKRRI